MTYPKLGDEATGIMLNPRRFRVGERVRFTATPAALMLYSSAPPVGAEGYVTEIGGTTQMRGSRGGMVYVEWDDYGTEGVFEADVERAGKGTKGYRVEFVRGHRGEVDAVLYDDKGRSLNLIHTGQRYLTAHQEKGFEIELMRGARELGVADKGQTDNPRTFLVARAVGEGLSDTYAVEKRGGSEKLFRRLMDIAHWDAGTQIEWWVVDAEDAGAARLVPDQTAWGQGTVRDDGSVRRNPPPGLTAKGRRMYEHVKRGYELVGDARAKEIAARTVRAQATAGTRGLVRNPDEVWEVRAGSSTGTLEGAFGSRAEAEDYALEVSDKLGVRTFVVPGELDYADALVSAMKDQAGRTLWVDAYASFVEEKKDEVSRPGQTIGETRRKVEKMGFPSPGPQEDWMDYAPETPKEAVAAADRLLGRYEELNKDSIGGLLLAAATADGIEAGDITSEYATEFGHYLGMMALGHGVSWFDDHAEFPLEVPRWFEVIYDGEEFWATL